MQGPCEALCDMVGWTMMILSGWAWRCLRSNEWGAHGALWVMGWLHLLCELSHMLMPLPSWWFTLSMLCLSIWSLVSYWHMLLLLYPLSCLCYYVAYVYMCLLNILGSILYPCFILWHAICLHVLMPHHGYMSFTMSTVARIDHDM